MFLLTLLCIVKFHQLLFCMLILLLTHFKDAKAPGVLINFIKLLSRSLLIQSANCLHDFQIPRSHCVHNFSENSTAFQKDWFFTRSAMIKVLGSDFFMIIIFANSNTFFMLIFYCYHWSQNDHILCYHWTSS